MEHTMASSKRQPSLVMSLTRYDFSIDFDLPERLVVLDTDILLSAHGKLDSLNYLYLIRPAPEDADWKIYYVKNKNIGFLPMGNAKHSRHGVNIIKHVKDLIK